MFIIMIINFFYYNNKLIFIIIIIIYLYIYIYKKSKYAAQVEFDKPNRIELTKREFTNSEERERNEKLKQILTKDRID